MTANSDNIILIGMPGAGKSTVGVLLAKALSRQFVDTDLIIQASEGRRLQEIIDRDGLAAFRAVEERHVLAMKHSGAVLATGGSVVYSPSAMAHLKASGTAVYLELPLKDLAQRITNMDTRGVARAPEQSFAALYAEREPLYREYADITVPCAKLGHDDTVQAILASFS
jgi:shikimate kinase